MDYNNLNKEELVKIINEKDNDLKKLIEEKEELKYYASTDVMTGLLNRRSGLELLDREFKSVKDIKGSMVVCVIDVDNLKIINDTFGHSEGDKVLISTAEIIKGRIRDDDFVVRMGGDEFLAVFPRTSFIEFNKLWNEICIQVDNFNKRNNMYKLSLSYGMYEYESRGIDALTINDLIVKADKEMYKNKYKKGNKRKKYVII